MGVVGPVEDDRDALQAPGDHLAETLAAGLGHQGLEHRDDPGRVLRLGPQDAAVDQFGDADGTRCAAPHGPAHIAKQGPQMGPGKARGLD